MRVDSSLIVLIGAISYGIPASIFKLATNNGVLPANCLPNMRSLMCRK